LLLLLLLLLLLPATNLLQDRLERLLWLLLLLLLLLLDEGSDAMTQDSSLAQLDVWKVWVPVEVSAAGHQLLLAGVVLQQGHHCALLPLAQCLHEVVLPAVCTCCWYCHCSYCCCAYCCCCGGGQAPAAGMCVRQQAFKKGVFRPPVLAAAAAWQQLLSMVCKLYLLTCLQAGSSSSSSSSSSSNERHGSKHVVQ
jgi:hypothetical protein